MLTVKAGLAATRGTRERQEDAAALWPGPAAGLAPFDVAAEPGRTVAVLADGMGGHAGGTIASRIACESFLASFAREAPSLSVRDRLRTGLFASNRAIALEVERDPTLEGMGSTLVGAVLDQDGLTWISVGDSPMYLWRAGEIALVNEDHSLAPLLDQLAREGKISADAARNDRRRHSLRSAVVGGEIELVDLSMKPLAVEAGDCIVLATDGIHALEPEEVARIVSGYLRDGAPVLARALVRAVDDMRDPYQDNCTIVVLEIAPA